MPSAPKRRWEKLHFGFGFDKRGQRDEGGDQRDEQGEAADDGVGQPHGVSKLRGGGPGGDEDEDRPDAGSDGGGGGVEDAAEIDAPGASFRWPKHADVGVDGDLQQGEPAADDEERKQEERIADRDGGRDEEKETGGHGAERGDDAGLVADASDDPAAGDGHDEVGAEEAEVDHQRKDIGEVKEVLEVGDEDVVQRGDEADAEVERDHQDHRQDVVRVRRCADGRGFRGGGS